MSKTTKIIITVVSCICAFVASFFVVRALTIKNAESKVFTKQEMSVELTSLFHEKEIVSQTAYYESSYMVVACVREGFDLIPNMSNWSLDYYTNLCITNNKLEGIEFFTSENGKYNYFTYEKNVNGKDFTYFATCHKSESAFWLIQFFTFSSKYEKYKNEIITYANSITFIKSEH